MRLPFARSCSDAEKDGYRFSSLILGIVEERSVSDAARESNEAIRGRNDNR